MRITETRAVISRLREANKEAVRQLSKITKQQTTDSARVSDQLGQLAEDVVNKLPEHAVDAEFDRARVIQEQIYDLAGEIDEVSLAGSSIEDLGGVLSDTINEIYGRLKEAETQLSKLDRLSNKIGI